MHPYSLSLSMITRLCAFVGLSTVTFWRKKKRKKKKSCKCCKLFNKPVMNYCQKCMYVAARGSRDRLYGHKPAFNWPWNYTLFCVLAKLHALFQTFLFGLLKLKMCIYYQCGWCTYWFLSTHFHKSYFVAISIKIFNFQFFSLLSFSCWNVDFN